MGKRAWLTRALAFVAKRCPSRPIPPKGDTYLTRYFLLRLPMGAGIFLHYFHRSDADRELHSHPWWGLALVLGEGYREERRVGHAGAYRVESRICLPLSFNLIRTDTFHRVDLLEPEAGCWTLFFAGPRTAEWGFWSTETGIFTFWRAFVAEREGVDWPTSEGAHGGLPWGRCEEGSLHVSISPPLPAHVAEPMVALGHADRTAGSCRIAVHGPACSDQGMGLRCASLDEARAVLRRFPAVLTEAALFDLGLRREG